MNIKFLELGDKQSYKYTVNSLAITSYKLTSNEHLNVCNSMNSERILITGGCGFVGSSLAIQIKSKYPGASVIAFDNLKRRGSELNIHRLKERGIEFIHGDIRNREDFNQIGEISILIDAAAEPSVLSGTDAFPDYVINTNLNGTINCLHFALKNRAKFVFISTSRVYPVHHLSKINLIENPTRFDLNESQDINGVSKAGISESFPLDGARSFYGTSKLASELIIQEFCEYNGLESIINRCGVLTGPWQMGKVDQGVVVLWMAKHFWKKELSYIGYGGKGLQVRDFLHVDDLFDLLDIQLGNIEQYSNQIFNVGGGSSVSSSLLELTKICEKLSGNQIEIKSILEGRPADVPLYITDNKKISILSGWEPKKTVEDIMSEIYHWIHQNEISLKPILA